MNQQDNHQQPNANTIEMLKLARNQVVKLEKPLTVMISGGTAKPNGSLKRFKETLQKFQLPVEMGEIHLAAHPLHSVTKGALIAAIADESKSQGKAE